MWLHLPKFCRSSLATADSTSALRPPAEPDLWCWSSGTPSPRPSSWRGWKKRPWRRLLSGTTCPPSMADAGVASWIASLAAVPAKTSPSPGSGLDSLVREAASGGPCSASPTRQGLLLFSGRTSEEQSPPRWTWSRKTLRTSASELRLALSALQMWVLPTSDSDSSSWPTPSATPYGSNQSESSGAAVRPSLQMLAQRWPTPRASDGAKGGPNQSMHGKPALASLAANWPTPTATDAAVRMGGAGQHRPHETSGTIEGGGLPHGRHSDSLPVQVRRGTPGMVLNPAFVEALMGVPRGWTSPSLMTVSASSVTASSGNKRRRRSSSAGSGCLEVRDA